MLKKPLQPFWVTPETLFSELPPEAAQIHPVICCTASRRVEGTEVSGNGYIQGAGDDSEAWSCGLTPQLFWHNRQQLMSTDEEELSDLIQNLLQRNAAIDKDDTAVLIVPTKNIYIGTLNAGPPEIFDAIILCNDQILTKTSEDIEPPGHMLRLRCGAGKLGSRALRAKMPLVRAFVSSLIDRKDFPKILIACSTGKDLSVGIALALLCLYYDDYCKL